MVPECLPLRMWSQNSIKTKKIDLAPGDYLHKQYETNGKPVFHDAVAILRLEKVGGGGGLA